MSNTIGSSQRRAYVLVGIMTGLWLLCAPASASAQLVECLGTEVNSYSPGVLLAPRLVTANVERIHAPCTSTSDPAITSGTIEFTVSLVTSCLTLLGGPPAATEQTVHWNTGETSVLRVIGSVQSVGGVIVILRNGTVISGKFAGATVLGTATMVAPPLLPCLSEPGLQSVSGPTTMTLLQ